MSARTMNLVPDGPVLIPLPSVRWQYVGSVPAVLALRTEDNSEPTTEQIENARHAGPRIAGVKVRTFDTREDALRAAEALGVHVSAARA